MAKIKAGFPLNGTLGNYSIYKRKGTEKIVIRAKGGPSNELIKTSPRFAATRKSNKEFSGAGMASGKIQRAMYAVTHLADPVLSGRLTSVATMIQKLDTENPVGKRSLLFSRLPNILNGFALNIDIPFDSYVSSALDATVSRAALSASITVPKLTPKLNFHPPQDYELYRVIAVLGIVPDMQLGLYEYEPVNPNTQYFPRQSQTEWASVFRISPETSLTIQLPEHSNFDTSCSLVLSVGIEFGKYLTEGLVKAGKQVGSAKILSNS